MFHFETMPLNGFEVVIASSDCQVGKDYLENVAKKINKATGSTVICSDDGGHLVVCSNHKIVEVEET